MFCTKITLKIYEPETRTHINTCQATRHAVAQKKVHCANRKKNKLVQLTSKYNCFKGFIIITQLSFWALQGVNGC